MNNIAIGDICIYTESNSKNQEKVLITSDSSRNGEVSIIQNDISLNEMPGSLYIHVSPNDIEKGVFDEEFVFPVNRQTFVHKEQILKKLGCLKKEKLIEVLKGITFRQTEIFYKAVHKTAMEEKFDKASSRVSYAGRVFDEKEMINLVDSSLDFWLTAGPYSKRFEKKFVAKIGVNYCSLVNSGSSANLLAFIALTSPKLKDRRIHKGDEVITVAAGFPTTVNPIVQYGAIPVFVDITIPTYNINVEMLETALSKKTKAVMIAHTLGNPFNINEVQKFCKKNNLWLIEDNCDALGSQYGGKMTGTFGDIATSSFYPPHHITMGEGGAVYTNSKELKNIIESFRDWGRDCSCPSGKDDTCKRRFEWQLGTLPKGYDHKYIYSHLGYNLKPTDLQASIGCAQLEKLDDFVKARQKNWKILFNGLKHLEEYFILPEATYDSSPSWFGFFLTLRKGILFSRDQIVQYLESKRIQTRMLFAGNYLRHPVFDEVREQGKYRVVGSLGNTDRVMSDSFWVGVYPGMNDDMLSYVIEQIHQFCQ